MKCICGYEYIESDDQTLEIGDEKFKIFIVNEISEKPITLSSGWITSGDMALILFVCPKCHTVRIG